MEIKEGERAAWRMRRESLGEGGVLFFLPLPSPNFLLPLAHKGQKGGGRKERREEEGMKEEKGDGPPIMGGEGRLPS